MKVGLFFGSFNPVHIGHMIIANFMATQTDLDQVWMVVSPQNPLKNKQSLAKDRDRLHLVHLAIDNNDAIRPSDIEFSLPKPSYTVDTLTYLKEKHPAYEFVLIMGGDNLATLPKWKNFELLIRDYSIYLYKRPNYDLKVDFDTSNVHFFDAPLLDISATYIRNCIKEGKSIRYLVPDPVFDYLEEMPIYR
ncbi:MAG: nicotinate (nicotinamide) nucleotide adenylyltransferase [Saprospiraceae bacterium]